MCTLISQVGLPLQPWPSICLHLVSVQHEPNDGTFFDRHAQRSRKHCPVEGDGGPQRQRSRHEQGKAPLGTV